MKYLLYCVVRGLVIVTEQYLTKFKYKDLVGWLVGWLYIIAYNVTCLEILHLYEDFTITSKRVPKLYLCPALMTFGGGAFSVTESVGFYNLFT